MMFSGLWNDAWSTAIVNHLWQSTLAMMVAWLLTLILRNNQARTRYWIWMAASLKLLIPFSLLAAIGGWLGPASVHPVESQQLTSTIIEMARPFVRSPHSSAGPGTASYGLSAFAPAAPHISFLPEVLAVVWLSGLLFLLLRWSRDWWSLHNMLRSASGVSLSIDVPVFLTSCMIEPGVFGVLRPVLLMPEQLMDRLPAAQLRGILAHESCHVRRRDNLTATMHMAVEAIFWFHPAVWWIEQRLIEERERACDEAVLLLGTESEVYAESILNVCKCYTESPLACMSGVTGSELKQRILRIMTKQIGRELDFGRKLLLSVVGMAAMVVPVAFGVLHMTEARAQSKPAASTNSVAATWQGTLHTDRDLRFVVKIEMQPDGMLSGTFYNLDGAPGGLPSFSTRLDGSVLKLDLAFATYEGTVSAEGSSIAGVWRQGSTAQPLILSRATQNTAWTIPPPPTHLPAMAAAADPEFEVATIKPSRPDEHGPRYMFDPRHFSVVHVTLSQLMQFSFKIQEHEITAAPDWFDSESYDISAVPGGTGEPSIPQWQSMVKKLMADRFQLKFHIEKREKAVYALTVAKDGPRLTRSLSDHGGRPGLGFGPPGNMGATNATMTDIAEALQQGALDRPVVDQTGLTGRFDLRLKWTPDDMHSATQGADAPPDLFTAIQEQVGLKLLSTRAPVDVIVVERLQRPSAN